MIKKAVALVLFILLALQCTLPVILNVTHANPSPMWSIELISPEKRTYNTNEVELNFIAPSKFAPKLSFTSFAYSLDGQVNVTVSGNTTITLPSGSHSIIVYGEGADGVTRSSPTVQFDVYFSTFWLALVVAVSAGAALIAVAAVVYLKKHRH